MKKSMSKIFIISITLLIVTLVGCKGNETVSSEKKSTSYTKEESTTVFDDEASTENSTTVGDSATETTDDNEKNEITEPSGSDIEINSSTENQQNSEASTNDTSITDNESSTSKNDTTTKDTTKATTTTKVTTTTKPTTTKATTTKKPTTGNSDKNEEETTIVAVEGRDVDTVVKGIINSQISSSMSAAEKVKKIHDYLVITVDYDAEGYNEFVASGGDFNVFDDSVFTVEGALINKLAVCEGYAEAFDLIMKEIGIKCIIVYGSGSNGVSHAWNMIEIDGNWYYVDVTYDDPLGHENGEYYAIKDGANMSYNNFLVPEWIIELGHVIDEDQTVERNKEISSYPTNTGSEKYIDYVLPLEYDIETLDDVGSVADKYFSQNIREFRMILPSELMSDGGEAVMNKLGESALKNFGGYSLSGTISTEGSKVIFTVLCGEYNS